VNKIFVLVFWWGVVVSAYAESQAPLEIIPDLAKQDLSGVSWAIGPLQETVPQWHLKDTVPKNPGSVMKLLTTWSALNLWGPSYVWNTQVKGNPPDQNGVMHTPLYLVGGGDPGMTIEQWNGLIQSLWDSGVYDVSAGVVLDQSLFVDPEDHRAGTIDQQTARAYNVAPAALQVGYKAMNISLKPDGRQVMIQTNLNLPEITIRNHLKVVRGPCLADWKSYLGLWVKNTAWHSEVFLEGIYPNQCSNKNIEVSVLSNDAYVYATFKKKWQELGGHLPQTPTLGQAPATTPVLLNWPSDSLAVLIQRMNKMSNNPMARNLFLDLSVQPDQMGSESASINQVKRELQEKGLDFSELVIVNGAGLSRDSRISAQHLWQILKLAHEGPWQPEFEAAFSLWGIDGTVRERELYPGCVIRVKTGTLEGARALAGIVRPNGGVVQGIVLLNTGKVDGMDTLVRIWFNKLCAGDLEDRPVR
jgi:D-alanyl-D-alanine carboxypeptidase/D-alanyl-D-alanine-endopeptidase (penicillin-binding protein 4)